MSVPAQSDQMQLTKVLLSTKTRKRPAITIPAQENKLICSCSLNLLEVSVIRFSFLERVHYGVPTLIDPTVLVPGCPSPTVSFPIPECSYKCWGESPCLHQRSYGTACSSNRCRSHQPIFKTVHNHSLASQLDTGMLINWATACLHLMSQPEPMSEYIILTRY